MTNLKNVFAAAAVALAIAAPGVYAQWAVFDSSNFIKNALTAAQSSAAAAQLLDQYKLQARQFITQMQNLQKIDPAIIDSAVGREIQAAAGYSTDQAVLISAGIKLLNVYQNASGLMNQGTQLFQQSADFGMDMNRFTAASGMAPEEVFSYEMKRAQAGQQAGQWRFRQAEILQRQLGGWQTRADQQLQAAQGAEGAVQAISAVAAMNHTMTDQLSTLVTLAANRERAEGAKVTTEGQDREQAERAAEDARKRNQSVIDYFSTKK